MSPSSLESGKDRPRREIAAWSVALALVALFLPLRHFASRDPDSALYAEIASRMSRGPVAEWIAPRWPPGWYGEGLYREHPVGTFVPAALLARLGYPAEQAAFAVNAGYQVLSLVLIARLASAVVEPGEARALLWMLQLLPIAFTFRVRANQEQAVLLLLVAALLGTERSRTRAAWAFLTAVSLASLLLVKGVLGLLGPVVCALWLLTRRGALGSSRQAWWGLAGAVAAMGVTIVAYELLYRRATGQPFLSDYLTRQLGLAAAPRSAALVGQKAYNFVWYLARLLWFPFPWSAVLLVAAQVRARPAGPAARTAAGGALLFVLGVAGLYLALFSLSDRRADRYIFPAYYALAAGGAIVALRRWPRLRQLAERLDRHPMAPALLFLLLIGLHVAAGALGLPTTKVWAPDS